MQLRDLRVNSGLSQSEVGKRLGLSCGQLISNIESGKADYPAKHFKKLAKMFSVDVECLIDISLESYEKRLRKKI